MEVLESRRHASELDLQNVQVLLQRYTELSQGLLKVISDSKVREDKLKSDLDDLDSRLALIGNETVNVENVVQALNPVEEFEKSTMLNVFFGHLQSVEALDFGNGRMVSGSADRTCRVWDLEKKCCIGVLDGHDGM